MNTISQVNINYILNLLCGMLLNTIMYPGLAWPECVKISCASPQISDVVRFCFQKSRARIRVLVLQAAAVHIQQ